MFLRGVHGVFHRFEKQFWVRFFAPYLLLSKASWTPFWPLSGRNLAKRGLAGPLWMTMSFLAPGPLFAFQTASIFQKGVWQQFFKDRLAGTFFLPTAGPILDHSAVQFRQSLAASFLDLPDLTFRFSAPAWFVSGPDPLKKKGSPATSFHTCFFSCCWIPFRAWTGPDPSKRGLASKPGHLCYSFGL